MTINVVPTPATRTIAVRMIRAAKNDTGADAVMAHLEDVRWDQIPALVALLLNVANNVAAVEAPAERRPKDCRCCGEPILSEARRGLRASCYYKHKRAGTLDAFPRYAKLVAS